MVRGLRDADDVRPDVLIPGFPKCGSTSLFDLLVTHPRIAGSVVKEPHFVSDPDRAYKRDEAGLPTYAHDGAAAYARLWPDAGPQDRRLDGTPFYAFYDAARSLLATPSADGRAPLSVMIVRRPSARVFSLYRALQDRAGRLSHDVDFARFVDQVRRGDPGLVDHDLQVRDCIVHCDYRRWIEPWREQAGPDRVIVCTLDALTADPGPVLTEVAARLDIDPGGFVTDLPRSNVTRTVRSVRVARLRRVATRSPIVRRLPFRRTLARWYDSMNVSGAPRTPTDAEREVMASIDEEVRASTEWLGAELGLDVAGW